MAGPCRWNTGIACCRGLHPRAALLRYDRRGFGLTRGPYDPGKACGDLLSLLDAARIDSAVLVGMSQGARVAIHTAIRAPQRVAALVLDGAPWFEDETELPVARYRKLRDSAGIFAMRDVILEHPLMQPVHARCGAACAAVHLRRPLQRRRPGRPVDARAGSRSQGDQAADSGSSTVHRTAMRDCLPDASCARRYPARSGRSCTGAGHLAALDNPAAVGGRGAGIYGPGMKKAPAVASRRPGSSLMFSS